MERHKIKRRGTRWNGERLDRTEGSQMERRTRWNGEVPEGTERIEGTERLERTERLEKNGEF